MTSWKPVTGWTPRWVHMLYALVMGYVWRPCPVCGRSFGEHERPDRAAARATSGGLRCPACAGRRRRARGRRR